MIASGFGFWMWRLTLARQWRLAPAVYRILCSKVRGQAGNLNDLTVASPQYDTVLCFETLVLSIHHVSELLVPGRATR